MSIYLGISYVPNSNYPELFLEKIREYVIMPFRIIERNYIIMMLSAYHSECTTLSLVVCK